MNNALTLLRLWCIVTLLSFHSFFISNLLGQCDPVSDSLALVALYNATNGDDWVDNTNWLVEGQTIGNWAGCVVDSSGCVCEINIFGISQTLGSLPPEIGDLTNLKVLNFWYSGLVGNIPSEIGNLPNLEVLDLRGNKLTGQIPPELGNLIQLKRLDFFSNQLNENLPIELFNLDSLLYLNLGNNHFFGSIPPEIGNLENLDFLNLSFNQLSGEIPPELGNLSMLSHLSLSRNQLSGSIPAEIGELENLTTLLLSNNLLSGSIPAEIGNLGNLIFLELGNNQLTGAIPSEIGNLSNLEMINISYNALTGNLPNELGNLISLNSLRISYNELTGSLPPEIGNLENLFLLDLEVNTLSGILPPEMGNMTSLQYLFLFGNELEGNIPHEIGQLESILTIDLTKNHLTGAIPPEIGNLSNLEALSLSDNMLTDEIPSELGNLQNLVNLNLGKNLLSGQIPSELFLLTNLHSLYLRDNHLTGFLSSDIGNLENIEAIDFAENSLTGKLPVELAALPNLSTANLINNQFYGCIPPQFSIFCGFGTPKIYLNGNVGLPNADAFYETFCLDGEGTCVSTISGKIVQDQNQNCLIDSLEAGLQHWMIKASSDQGDIFSLSNINGDYGILPNPESYPNSYFIEIINAPGPYWEENCTGIQNVIIEDSLSLDTINFFPSAIALCPYLTVDISTSRLRRCFDNTFKIDYCNYGTVNAEEALVKIHFDPLLNVNSASIPIAQQEGNTYTFDLGEVQVGECGSFFIFTTVSCDSELGQTLCATAKIYPDSLCAGFSEEWSGANIEVEGYCESDEVIFTITNTGEGDMQSEQTYTIIQDGVIITPEPIPFFLSSGESIEVNFEANGSTYACQTTPVPFHPFESIPSAFVEACGTNETGGFSTGFATQFPENDSSPFVSIDCQQVIGSFDPNDKRGFPEGYGESHYIERGQDIEYLIRFQNTGTDTAFTVVVEDVLSPYLEMTSLRLGASSHPYNLEIVGSDTLKFIFESILLVDSTANEPASHGFIKFRISQKPELPLGTVIENQAAISFDFNDPVLTNTTFHTIGENFVEVEVNQLPYIPGLEVSIAPNPVTIEAVIRITGIDFQEAEFRLFNAMGIEVKRDVFSGQELALKKGDLPEGLYVFEVLVDGQIGGVGKLVVE